MALTDTKIRNLKPVLKDSKLSDSGGLYLLVKPNGSKLWRLKYRLGKKEGVYAIGSYPQVTLAEARAERDLAKKLIAEGKNPTTVRKLQRLENVESAENCFEPVAREFYAKVEAKGKTVMAKQAIRLLECHVFPHVGNVALPDIRPAALLTILQGLEKRGIANTATRVRLMCGQVFRYGVATLRCEYDPTASIRGAVTAPLPVHHKPADDPQAVWKTLSAYRGTGGTRYALLLLMLTVVRSTELRHMEKDEIDLKAALWRIPEHKMKKGRPHIVPLARQAVELLEAALELSGDGPYVFPSLRKPGQPISDSTMGEVMKRLKVGITPHGCRSTFSTHLHGMNYPPHLIEMQLAHAEDNRTKAAYNHAQYLPERRTMMQEWADWLTAKPATHSPLDPTPAA